MAQTARDKRKTRQRKLGFLLIALSLFLVASVGIALGVIRWVYPELNRETLCPQDGPVSITVILFDRTDSLTPAQRGTIERRLNRIKREISRHSKLVLYTVGAIDEELLEPFCICNPGNKEDINPFWENRRLIEKRWQEDFSNRLDEIFSEMLQPDEGNTSPILESIQSIGITSLSELKIPKKLIAVSDMLHKTPLHNQYDGVIPFEEFRGSSYYRKIKVNLKGVKVEIHYVRRETRRNIQGGDHIQFWQDYFFDMGGELRSVKAIYG